MNTDKIMERENIPDEYKWASKDLYPSDEAFLSELEEFMTSIKSVEEFGKNGITDSKSLLEFYRFQDGLFPVINRLTTYSGIKCDENTQNQTYQDYKNRVGAAYVQYNSACSFMVPQLLKFSDDEIEKFYEEEPDLLFYRKDIEENRRMKSHILDEASEKMLAMAGEMMDTPDNVYCMLSYADLEFEPVVHEGKTYPLTQGTFVSLLQNQDREIRCKAFSSFYTTYGKFKNTFAALLSSQVKALSFESTLRGYDSTLACALDHTNVNTDVYHNLIDTVHKNMHYMHQYVSLRKKLLGVDELHMYDVYAPLVPQTETKISFDEARGNVLAATSVFGQEYTSVLESGFNNHWIDIYENKGKRSGAYSSGAYVHPFVLLNYNNNLDSEFILAHEMGHAMHSYLSNTHQPPIYSGYKIFVAEVASTCNESLLMQYLLKKTTEPKERAVLINHFLEQFKGTLYRQTMFAEFELKINELYRNGESITSSVLCDIYKKLNEEYFGPDMVIDEEIALEWARIPHFYYNYYVYQYATGFSAAIALSDKILNEGEPAVEKYLNFLSSGCTKDPVSLLRDAGVDMATPEPVETALKLFGNLIDEIETLLQ